MKSQVEAEMHMRVITCTLALAHLEQERALAEMEM
jgi:hypothetical protein